jgi:hypothetical protein
MRRLAPSLLLALCLAVASAVHAQPIRVVPADDPDVTAGWAA